MSTKAEHIREIAQRGLDNDSLFIVDVKISEGVPSKVSILLDGDNGVTIGDCSKVSKYVGSQLEEDEKMAEAYTLDVGSPGLDNPLLLKRQYVKNIGRKLKVRQQDGDVVTGELVQVNEENIELKVVKKGSQESVTIIFSDIDWAKVQVSFN